MVTRRIGPDEAAREGRRKVSLLCLNGQHETCHGHASPGLYEVSTCGCPDASHSAEPDTPHPLTPATATPAEVHLTTAEVKRIVGAHMVMRHETALDVVRTIIAERLANPEGAL